MGKKLRGILIIAAVLALLCAAGAGGALASVTAQQDAYLQVLRDTHAEFNDEYGSADYLLYSLYDIDGDGVEELLVLAGTCEADFLWRIYTMTDDGALYIGETFGGHSTLYACPEGGFYNMMGHMGYQEIYRVTYANDAFDEELISSKELAEDEEYDTPGVSIDCAWITDYSLLYISNSDVTGQ